MSLSLDKLRLLRRQAGDATPAAPTPPAAPAPVADAALPAAANDARARKPAPDSVFAWVEQEIKHKPTGMAAGPSAPATAPPAPALRRPDVGGLHRLLGLRERGAATPRARASAQDRHVPGEQIADGLFLIEAFLPQPIPTAPLSLA